MIPQRLALDFVAVPAAARASRWVLLAGVAAAAIAGARVAPGLIELEQQRRDLAALVAEREPAVARAGKPVPGLRTAQAVATQLQAPWEGLLASLESVRTKDVALLAVEPTAARQSLRITADARNPDAMLDMLAQLRQQRLTDVVLVSHQVQEKQPGTPIRFQIQARWTDATGQSVLDAASPGAEPSRGKR